MIVSRAGVEYCIKRNDPGYGILVWKKWRRLHVLPEEQFNFALVVLDTIPTSYHML